MSSPVFAFGFAGSFMASTGLHRRHRLEHFESAESTATSEATRLSELWRDGLVLPGGNVNPERLLRLHRSVIHDDWPSMAAQHGGSDVTARKYESLWRSYYAVRLVPSEAAAGGLFRESLWRSMSSAATAYACARRRPQYPADVGPSHRRRIGHDRLHVSHRTEHALFADDRNGVCGWHAAWAVLIVRLADPYSGDVSVRPTRSKASCLSFDAERAEGPPPGR